MTVEVLVEQFMTIAKISLTLTILYEPQLVLPVAMLCKFFTPLSGSYEPKYANIHDIIPCNDCVDHVSFIDFYMYIGYE